MDKNYRRTKIVCTLGPASSSPATLEKMMLAGMNVARLNFSHGSHDSHQQTVNNIREISKKLGLPVGILQDLSGPKIRLGELAAEIRLENGQTVMLGAPSADHGHVCLPVTYPYLYEDVQVGNRILLADGLVELKVVAKKDNALQCEVSAGGVLSSHKGVNLPTSQLRIPAFTDKDKADLELGIKMGVDFVAMSFVRHENDVQPVRERLRQSGLEFPPLLIAKIEKPQALERFSQILAAVDGIMVARGDLGVEMPLEQVPIIQKRLIDATRRASKIVITATQLLRSMIDNPRPTRAEVNDVANAILDGTDAVMLSEESAMGAFPVESVQVLDKVALATEPTLMDWRFLNEHQDYQASAGPSAAISHAVCLLAKDLQPAAIVATTHSGGTARLISRYRPPTPIVGLSSSSNVCRQLCLSWGVAPMLNSRNRQMQGIMDAAASCVSSCNIAGKGDRIIITTGFPLGSSGTNLIKVADVN